ncbi:hypothetical protein, partial [Escherichia coli]|uniref:hypothetical protein n=1 Tax=Escherichia coli TaxID=562 RepID=UPI00339D0A6A
GAIRCDGGPATKTLCQAGQLSRMLCQCLPLGCEGSGVGGDRCSVGGHILVGGKKLTAGHGFAAVRC